MDNPLPSWNDIRGPDVICEWSASRPPFFDDAITHLADAASLLQHLPFSAFHIPLRALVIR